MKRVLFLCIGNSCRSQMAEGFARKYGADVMEVGSAGLSPAGIVQPLTQEVMNQKNINIEDQFPKDLASVNVNTFDLIVNMSGVKLPGRIPIEVRDWKVDDPIGRSEEVYVTVRDQIEGMVMQLILQLRREARRSAPAPSSGGMFRRTR
jgi:arsenate reductase (thioredoxin)